VGHILLGGGYFGIFQLPILSIGIHFFFRTSQGATWRLGNRPELSGDALPHQWFDSLYTSNDLTPSQKHINIYVVRL